MSSRSIPVTILNGEHHIMSKSSKHTGRHPRHNPDAAQAGKSIGAALVGAVVLAAGARSFASMKKADGTLAYTEKQDLGVVAVVGGVAGIALASMKNPLAQIAGTAILGATAALTIPPAYDLYKASSMAPGSTGTNQTTMPPALPGERQVALGAPRMTTAGQPVLAADGTPLLRTAGLFGLASADAGRTPYPAGY